MLDVQQDRTKPLNNKANIKYGKTLDWLRAYANNSVKYMRPKKCRRTCCKPCSNYFKPRGIPLNELQEIVLAADEIEAIKLADLEGLYQEDAAKKMKISRQTFGRIIESAHYKISDAVINGKALKLEDK